MAGRRWRWVLSGAMALLLVGAAENPAAALAARPAPAAAANVVLDDDFFVLSGRYHERDFGYGFLPFLPPYEDNYLLGIGYQHFFFHLHDDYSIGAELGADVRFGVTPSTEEVWGGVVGRYDGWTLDNWLHVAPAVTFGLSYETGMVGVEAEHVAPGASSALLFYIGPELDFSLAADPQVEMFWRIQHRSGAWGTLGHMSDSANATTAGLRFRFQ